jgi:hypothetical protein
VSRQRRPEAGIVAQIRAAVGMRKDVVLWRVEPHAPPCHVCGAPSAYPTAPEGFPDLFGVVRDPDRAEGRMIMLEVKTPVGALNTAQRQFHGILHRMGCRAHVVRSVADAVLAIEEEIAACSTLVPPTDRP